MTYANEPPISIDDALIALADPTRRAVLESLRTGPRSVGEIAEGMPVSRPAVSQHLKRLKDSGLVFETPQGTKRLYAIRREGLAPLRRYLESYWDDVLGAFQDFMIASQDKKGPSK